VAGGDAEGEVEINRGSGEWLAVMECDSDEGTVTNMIEKAGPREKEEETRRVVGA